MLEDWIQALRASLRLPNALAKPVAPTVLQMHWQSRWHPGALRESVRVD